MSNSFEDVEVKLERARLTLRILGQVQGVGFRFFIRKAVAGLPIDGWVRNEDDGTVSIVAEGPVEELNKLLEAVSEGPDEAEVDDVEVSWTSAFGDFEGFRVKLW
ncbi:MAG: acylphosphatase [Bacteroidetes bacterium]|nr:MAG: acylphosphatase [Bacteroidota bacterium]